MAKHRYEKPAFLDGHDGPLTGAPDYCDALSLPYPLESLWDDFCTRLTEQVRAEKLVSNPEDQAADETTELYLACAGRIARDAVTWLDEFGAIIDPYLKFESSTCTPRFVGLAGQLVGTGRHDELFEPCVRAYENCLSTLRNPQIHPEFAFKELLLAHRALAPRVEADRLEKWVRYWRAYDSQAAFNCVRTDVPANSKTFAAAGEQLRIAAGLGGDPGLVDRLLGSELSRIDEYGMYHDPHCPMTYHAVVLQQLGMVLLSGYDGVLRRPLERAVRRGAVTSLFMQSSTGQAPFGGRSNQFQHTEAQNAALFEEAAGIAMVDGDLSSAEVFRAAAAAGISCIAPWILDETPWRHIKQGFHPDLDHGTDSGGPYSVYGILTGSLTCIAASYHAEFSADVVPGYCPADIGGYAFEADRCFAKGFATACGYTVEVDLRATVGKDATGHGRIQHASLRPEAIVSGPVPGSPEYTCAFPLPQANLSVCPVWGATRGDGGQSVSFSHRLADFSDEVVDSSLEATRMEVDVVSYETRYRGNFDDGVEEIVESVVISHEGVRYEASIAPAREDWGYVIPVIVTDGAESSTVEQFSQASDDEPCNDGPVVRLQVTYRGGSYEVEVECGYFVLTDEVDTNRNARYRAVYVIPEGDRMTLIWRCM